MKKFILLGMLSPLPFFSQVLNHQSALSSKAERHLQFKVTDSPNDVMEIVNILRNILEKTASFHGFAHFSSCIRKEADEDGPVYKRILDLLSHGNYSLFAPIEMVPDRSSPNLCVKSPVVI